jgi:hypothetical protein
MSSGRKKYVIDIPEKWDDIKPEQWLLVSPYLISDSTANRIDTLKAFVPYKAKDFFFALKPKQLTDLVQLLDWMYDVDNWFDTPYISSFEMEGETYLLPAKYLAYSTVIEYTFADKFFEQIMAGDSTKLDNLILSLCRPKRQDAYDLTTWDGDDRERFNPVLIEYRLEGMKKVDYRMKCFFLLFFIGCKKTLGARYSPLFVEREESEAKPKGIPNFGWVGIIWDLAGNITNEEKVQYSNLHNVMAYLCKKHYDNEELAAKQRKHELSSSL